MEQEPEKKHWWTFTGVKNLLTQNPPWSLATTLIIFVVFIGGLISIFNPAYTANGYFNNVSIVTAALLLAIGGWNGRRMK